MAGAVDLAAVKARSEAAARAATAPPPAADAAIVSVTEAGFQAEVLDRSYQVPVLINVMAVGSPASDQLAPVLEKLAGEGAGAWVLAVLDVDASPRVAQALQVQSVPTVFAVIAGQLIPGFSGALPEEQVREFVSAVLDAGAQSGLSGPSAPAGDEAGTAAPEVPSDPRFDAAEAALDAGTTTGPRPGSRGSSTLNRATSTRPWPCARPSPAATRRDAGRRRRPGRSRPERRRRPAGAPPTRRWPRTSRARPWNVFWGSFLEYSATIARRVRDRLLEYFELLGPADERVPAARRRLANALF